MAIINGSTIGKHLDFICSSCLKKSSKRNLCNREEADALFEKLFGHDNHRMGNNDFSNEEFALICSNCLHALCEGLHHD